MGVNSQEIINLLTVRYLVKNVMIRKTDRKLMFNLLYFVVLPNKFKNKQRDVDETQENKLLPNHVNKTVT